MSAATVNPALPIPHGKSRVKAATRKLRELGIVGHALASTHHVVMAKIVPMRFCNLSCAYCNEYDKVSEPVPVDEMLRRIDHLARLGTSIITISGGEPLTHPDLDQIIARIRHHGRL
ncbi:MAG TPA: radical SAM protein, partial [Acidobacteriaceae bacterium]|nr:radical SAM protein [Acidobacteriaceae bacterium]